MKSVCVLVCGSRTWSDDVAIGDVLCGLLHNELATFGEGLRVIEGGAKGADERARSWYGGREDGLHLIHDGVWHDTYPANWDKDGKAAGPIRNQRMLEEGQPDLVWAFVDKPLAESKGTADMVRRARKAGLPVYVVEKIA